MSQQQRVSAHPEVDVKSTDGIPFSSTRPDSSKKDVFPEKNFDLGGNAREAFSFVFALIICCLFKRIEGEEV